MSKQNLSPEIISEFVEWDNTKEYPTPDEVINAFEKGVEKSKEAEDRVITQAHLDNLRASMSISEGIYKYFNKIGLPCFKIFLNINIFGKYEAIFVVDENRFLDSEKRNKAYNHLRKVKKEKSSDSFKLYFNLMPHSEQLDLNKLSSDGFLIRYEPKQQT